MKKRLVAMLTVLAMCLTVPPLAAFAAEDYTITLACDSELYKPMNDVKSVVELDATLTVGGEATASDFNWSTDSPALKLTSDGRIVLDKNTVNGTYNVTATSTNDEIFSETFAITVADGAVPTALDTGYTTDKYEITTGPVANFNSWVTLSFAHEYGWAIDDGKDLFQIGTEYGTWTDILVLGKSGTGIADLTNDGKVLGEYGYGNHTVLIEMNVAKQLYNLYVDGALMASEQPFVTTNPAVIAGRIYINYSDASDIHLYSGRKLETVAISGEATVNKPLGDVVSKVKYTADKAVNWSTNDANTAIDANGNLYLNKNSAASIVITATDKTDSVVKGAYTVTVNPGYYQDFTGEPLVTYKEDGVTIDKNEIYTPGVFTDYEGQRVFGSWGSVSGIHFDAVTETTGYLANSGIKTIEFDFKRNFNAVEKFLAIGKSQNWGEYITINAVEKDDSYTLTDVATGTEIGTVSNGWHKFKMEIDFDNGLYDFRVDGVKIADNVAFDKADARGIGKALIPSGYVDNLTVYSGTEAVNSENDYELTVNTTEPYGDYAQFEAKVFVNNEAAKSYNVIIAQYEKDTNKLIKVVSNEASLNGEGMISALLKNTGESAGTYVKVMVVDSASKLTPYGNAVTVNSAE